MLPIEQCKNMRGVSGIFITLVLWTSNDWGRNKWHRGQGCGKLLIIHFKASVACVLFVLLSPTQEIIKASVVAGVAGFKCTCIILHSKASLDCIPRASLNGQVMWKRKQAHPVYVAQNKTILQSRLLVEFLDKHGKKKPRYWFQPSFLRLHAICTFTMNFFVCDKPPALWFKILDDIRAWPPAPVPCKQKRMHASQFNAFVWQKISTLSNCCYGEVIKQRSSLPEPTQPSQDKFLVPHGARRKYGRKQTHSNSRQTNKTARR